MNKIILKAIVVSIAIAASLTSCDTDPTLQSYIVDSDNKEGFTKATIPVSILGIDESKLSEESQIAYNSIDKVSMLMYPKTADNDASFETEKQQLSDILKNDKYTALMTHNQDGMTAKFLYQGDKDSIDEIIVFGTMDKSGMGVARILGDDMNISSIMKMMNELKNSDIDTNGIKDMLKGLSMDLGMDNDKDGKIDQQTTDAIHEAIGLEDVE
ncbi:uncharacterized protein DUF4252 [Nonlabens dokdonensis]|uniref:Membrane or secreted protein n=2 Tax=Nonlabens dokdonensis TaxID=328515 RepID=L7WG00_NONDD|nr:DUF4252 domain-containing protein [Nonlabens dokdonensis]AGC77818.1 membrane or secreted protein [Nonlabens dokdonensis DSW-6]PZX39649.1 uncharacterized protein DUF4252 [Nonlabens dokdonensis]